MTTSEKSRRSESRHAVAIKGAVLLDNGRDRIDCEIVNISVGGARIALKPWRMLPDSVYLYERAGGNIFECQVRWQGAEGVGLHFIDACSLTVRRRLIGMVTGDNALR